MPELEWHLGYPAVLGLMALTGVLFIVFFRRRGWL
jgi:magnesium transporter